ncbi:GNAT family N-acetyltransferase [Actinacidiphila acidipaludis]|uniref:GNAT family N-acetyltransferase n=1 Tax=Actinacidiphila acidipaludis TaxID=2873382 RepID=A0ABS7Q382_9ACTN|nr:GNAT family N-acetyltransferase [Streptomyces acidipaludis]MBY8877611.1 GNAT family N-acetyltransferase [Streptomyces acidipaludis]
MPDLRIERAHGDDQLRDWQYVHNLIVPPDPLSLDDVRERSRRNLLDVAYAGERLVGCMTVRAPEGEEAMVVVIARVLPEFRGRGYGGALYARGLEQAEALGAGVVETVVLGSNPEGLRFALAQGFVETERYVLPGGTVPYIGLRLR